MTQHDQVATRGPFAQNIGAAGTEIRLAAGDCLGNVDIGTALADGDVETGVAVETLLKRRVVAGELKLVLPFELQGNLFERNGLMHWRKQQARKNEQPCEPRPDRGPSVLDRWQPTLCHSASPELSDRLTDYISACRLRPRSLPALPAQPRGT